MKVVRSQIDIEAPAQRVWETITDLEHYPEWNTFTPRISVKKIVVGDEFDLDCQMTEKQLLKNEHEVFLTYDPERYKVCWGTSRTKGRPGIKSFRWQICEPINDRRTHFVNYEEFHGILAPIVSLMYNNKLKTAYDIYCQALKKRLKVTDRSGAVSDNAELTKEETLKLEEYKLTLDFICHDEIRKGDYFKIFTFAQAGLFALFQWSRNSAQGNTILIIIAVVAIFFSIYWGFITDRIRALINIRYEHLVELERQLKPFLLISNEMIFKQHGSIEIGGIPFKLTLFQRFPVSKAETLLPFAVALVWIVLIALSHSTVPASIQPSP